MTEDPGHIMVDELDPKLRSYFKAHPRLNYTQLADELHILIEMVFGKDHSDLSPTDKEHLKDLHDVIDHYKVRSDGNDMNMAVTVAENRSRVERVMETYEWVINEVHSRYSTSQLKYVEYLLDYMDHARKVISLFLKDLDKE